MVAFQYFPQLVWICAVLITTAFGTFANVLLLVTLCVYKPLRQSSSCPLIIHCIAINLYMTAVTVPGSTIPSFLGPNFDLPHNFCRYQVLFSSAYPLIAFSECLLALHRLSAVILPDVFRSISTRKATTVLIVLPWLMTTILNAFPVAEVGFKFIRSKVTGGCAFISTEGSTFHMLLLSIFASHAPTAVMGLSYLVVLVKTSRDLKRRRSSRNLRRRMEISRTLFVSFLWQCMTIYPILFLLAFFGKQFSTNIPLQLGIRWLTHSYSAINPVFFWASSRLFQEGAREVFRCRCWMQLKQHGSVGPQGEPHGEGTNREMSTNAPTRDRSLRY
ncbi:hypothetical protein BV898_03065 [Hypsibius exemplaris]|uniref:G-protein coupled receptors family 1 profile domain-containing protein n=1 Tax=Hypsibius exemplaris TaxID=2072580 RepID=A0A1W0X631_HYPEX|nr:hypothetical protein BV898_03065 [Hypsibius exemplaris]